jgi:hypothetical protein
VAAKQQTETTGNYPISAGLVNGVQAIWYWRSRIACAEFPQSPRCEVTGKEIKTHHLIPAWNFLFLLG